MEKAAYQCKNVFASSHTAHNLSRHELLEWINSSLGQRIQKVESLCSGAVYCQFMNNLFPGCLSLKKIKFDATQEHEFITNFKQLQIAFRKVGCDKDVPIDRLIKGRFQENFEFLQWFRRFFDANFDHEHMSQPIAVTKQQDVKPQKVLPHANVLPNVPDSARKQKKSVMDLESQVAELNEKAEIVSRERDFYFKKLRNIEILCTDLSQSEDANDDGETEVDNKTVISKILKELYATEDKYDDEEEEEEAETY